MSKILKKLNSFFWGVVEVIVIIFVIVVTSFILCRNKYGYTEIFSNTFVSVHEDNENYLPKSKNGDLLVIGNKKDIKKGDLVYYYATINERYVVRSAHVISMVEGDGNAVYTLDDKYGSSIISYKILGKNCIKYSKYGYVVDILVSRLGFLFLVLLPIMIIFIYRIYDFIMVLKYEKVPENTSTTKEKTIEKVTKKEEPEEVKKEIKVEEKEEVKDKENNVEIL